MKLVIVESPSKAKTIEKYLGKDYHVIASKGHIIDLPKGKLGVDTEHDFKPDYVVTNRLSVKLIKDNYKDATELVLAVDPDREGEAIGWHVARMLNMISDSGRDKKNTKPLKRIVFTEITKEAVNKAIDNPREIDINLVNAQQARRILDRIVGYKLSPLLWKKIAIGLSAGRVQSVAVRIIVAREEEREKFKSDEYWNVKAFMLQGHGGDKKYMEILSEKKLETELPTKGLKFELTKILKKKPNIKTGKECKKIFSDIKNEDLFVTSVEQKESNQYPKPPFTTSTLQQTASNALGYSASKTMKVAQQLYEAGHISYMRTDSTNLSSEAIEKIRKTITTKYGAEYVPEKPIFYKSRAALTQEAHEAIRPSHVNKTGDELGLTGDHARLYDLIYRRAVSCQMRPAKMLNTSISLVVKDYTFQLSAPKVIFPGYLIMYKNRLKEFTLPEIKQGDKLSLDNFVSEQNFTEPPARFTEATLIKEMEKNGIGRPSTYAPTISTIIVRKYVEKENKFLVPTSIGRVVDKLLVNNFPEIVDLSFTASMEENLDKIAEGNASWVDVLKGFYKGFEKDVKKGEKDINKQDYVQIGKSDQKCPICGKGMVIKVGRFGEYLSCKNFPECKGILSLNKNGQSQEDLEKKAKSAAFTRNYKPAPKSDDGRNYSLKLGRFGYYWSHPDSPKVKQNVSLQLNDEIFAQVYGKVPKSSDGKDMILKRGRFGEFWTHPDYPEKKEIISIKKSVINKKKKELGLL